MNVRDRIVELRRVPAKSLAPNPRNWRRHPKAQADALRGVLAEVGIADAVLAREREDGVLELVDGHLRAETLGDREVPVLVLDVNEEEAWKILATHDPLAAMAEADPQILDDLLREVETSNEQLKAMLDELGRESGVVDQPKEIVEDEVPEPPADPITKPGDLWLLGEHRLLCGDSTKAEDVERLMAGEKADMVFTDPPYGCDYTKKSDGASIANDGSEFEQVIAGALSLVQVDTAYVCGDVKTAGAFLRATSCLGEPKNCIVWVKPIQHRMHRYEPCHELIWFWGDNGPPFYGANVFEAKREIQKFHPTVKPVELVEYCLGSHKDKKVVLDLFGGSGTTLIAAEQLGRKCYGMEISPAYCDVIVKRWETLTGKKATRG